MKSALEHEMSADPFTMSFLFSSSPVFPLLTLTVRLGNGGNVSMIVLWNIFFSKSLIIRKVII